MGIAATVSMAVHRDLGQTYADRLGLLMRWSSILASSLDKRQVFERLARAAVPFLSDWCTVVVRNPKGGFQRVGVAHADPAIDRSMHEVPGNMYLPSPGAKLGIPRVMRTGEPELIRRFGISELLKELTGGKPDAELVRRVMEAGASSMMTAPLIAHGEILGAMSMYNGSKRNPFDSADLALAEELSRRAALTLYTLLRLEATGRELEVFEHAMGIYRNFLVSRVEDARTPLCAGRLKVELMLRREDLALRDRKTVQKLLEDFDRATMVISTIADEDVYEKLMAEVRFGSASAVRPRRRHQSARPHRAEPSRSPRRGLPSKKRA